MSEQHTLEQQLIAFCERHGLAHVSLNVTRSSAGWMIYAHAQCETTEGRFCGSSGYDTDTFAAALPEALAGLNGKRLPVEILPIEGVSA